LESEEHECPDCNEKDVSPETLIPNRFLRNAVMNFKNETGYAKRQTYRAPIHSTGSASSTDQPKTEIQQTQQSQVSSQTKTVQSSAAPPNTTSQESVEPQSTDLESTSQHFPTTSGSQPQTSTSKCFLVTCVIVQYIQF
jgi:E3 ubiquitin-protein ligase RBBP6